jgi:tocopherol O-methyltransferase
MTADWMAWFYRLFWGPNLHHGYFDRPGLSPIEAQRNLKYRLTSEAGITGPADVLEVGFGFGETAMWLARRFGCHVTAITISPTELRIARLTARSRRIGRMVDFRILDAVDLSSLPSGSFDCIWYLESAEFLEDKAKLLRDSFGLLRPGGRAILCGLMRGPQVTPRDQARYIEPLLDGFGVPPYAGLDDYLLWFGEAGFVEITGEDLTPNVLPTGERGDRILARPEVRFLCRLAPPGIRRTLQTFPLVFEAYRHRAMCYALVVGTKP